ncbi:MAG: TonB-dependent receptor [Betaproteobacteria bacterium]|nr:TonB-dependent receptor [Betaproteobacteria bacterium]
MALSSPLASALTGELTGPVPDGPEQIVVTATREGVAVSEAPASVTIVTAKEIAERRAARLGDVLSEVPGLYLRSNAQGAVFPSSGQASIALRGVPRTARTLVMIDGQPVNNAISGGIDLSSILLENVRRIEVVRGPYSALYGGNAMGGVIHVLTQAPASRQAQVKVESAMGDLRGSALSATFRDRFENGLGLVLALGYRESEGIPDSDYVVKPLTAGAATLAVTGARPTTTPAGAAAAWVGNKGARPWRQANAELKLSRELGAAGTVTGGIAYAGYRVGYDRPESFLTNSAGERIFSGTVNPGLTPGSRVALAETDFFTFTPSFEQQWRAHLRWEANFDNGMRAVMNAGHMDHNFRFALPGSGARYDGGPGEWSDQPNRRTDIDAHMKWMPSDDIRLTAGAAWNQLRLDRRTQDATSWRDVDSVTTEKSRSLGKSGIAALFAEAAYTASQALTVSAGGRFDRFTTEGLVSQSTAPAFMTTYGQRSEQRFSPKVAAIYVASPSVTLRASAGGGFRPPTLLDLYTRSVAPSNVAGVFSINEPAADLKAERIRAVEAGFDWQRSKDVKMSGAIFSQTLSNLIYRSRKSATLTQSVNAGRARIDGVELDARARLGATPLSVFASASYLHRYDITDNPAVPASVGKRLPDVPGRMINAGIEYQQGALQASLVARRVGHVFGSGDDTNANTAQGVFGSYDARTTLHARAAWRITPRVRVALSVENVGNKQYFDFFKQAGTTAFAEVTVTY